MKTVTEFASFNLNQGLKAKAALAGEGKTPEEIQTSLGESFKLEGEKLKYFVNALDVASQNQENLKRVLVVSLAEGENMPPKALKIEEMHFVPEFHIDPKRAQAGKADARGGKGGKGRGGRGGAGGGPKESPWGLSPEEKAAKAAKSAAAQARNNKPKT